MKSHSEIQLQLLATSILAMVLAINACAPADQKQHSISELRERCRQSSNVSNAESLKQQSITFQRCLEQENSRIATKPHSNTSQTAAGSNQVSVDKETAPISKRLQDPAHFYMMCLRNQADVIRLDKEKTRAEAELIQASSHEQIQTPDSVRAIEARLAAVERELQRLIPPDARGAQTGNLNGAELQKFKACNRADFNGSPS